MGASIDGVGSGAADAPDERPPERKSDSWPDWRLRLSGGVSENDNGITLGEIGPEEPADEDDRWLRESEPAAVDDTPRDLKPRVRSQDVNDLPEIERQSVIDSVNGFVEWAERQLVAVGANALFPGIGGHIVELAFEFKDVVMSIRALGSDDPVLEVPLPSPVQGFGVALEIPLPSGEEAHAGPPLALCIAPDAPSLTGGWALDSPGQDERPDGGRKSEHGGKRLPDAEEEELEHELDQRKAAPRRGTADIGGQREIPAADRSATSCIVETDLGSLPLLRRRKLRAWQLCVLATEYAPRFRENLCSAHFEVLVIADRQRRCGLWIWLSPDRD
jgi:hypothetical protein